MSLRRVCAFELLVLLCVGLLAACSYPPFDRTASESLSFRRWLERSGELVEQFDIPVSEVGYFGPDFDAGSLRYVPSMAVTLVDGSPTLALDWGVLVVANWPDFELLAIEDGAFERSTSDSRGYRFARDRYNAWGVHPAIYPGTGESGAIAYYVRTDDSELGTVNPGFRFDVGLFTGLHPDGTVGIETAGDPVVGLSDEQEERILAVGFSAGAFAVLFADESGGGENPPVGLSLFQSHDLVSSLGDPPLPFATPLDIASSLPLATRALEARRLDVGSLFFEVQAPVFFSAVGVADPFGVGSGGDPGLIAASFPAGDDEYRTLLSGIELDAAEINESVDIQGGPGRARIEGFLSDQLISARERSAFEVYEYEDLNRSHIRRSAGSVHHIISLPSNFAELVDSAELPGGNETFVSYFTAARPVETADGSLYIRVSVYAVASEAFENGN